MTNIARNNLLVRMNTWIACLLVCISTTSFAQFNYTVKITKLYAEADDCDGDIAGICTSAPQDPVFEIWAFDNLGNSGTNCFIFDNDPAMDFAIWNDITDYTILSVNNTTASTFFLAMRGWEADGLGTIQCTYDSGGDDNFVDSTLANFTSLGAVSTSTPYTAIASLGNFYKAEFEITKQNVASVDNLTKIIGFEVYPNPGFGSYTIRIDANEQVRGSVTIRNQLGQTVKQLSGQVLQKGGNTLNLDIVDQPNGVYFVEVAGEGGVITKRIVKI